MKIKDLFLNINNPVYGDFSDLSKFDFNGVYIIYDEDEVVYVGSAYARKIKKRLKQYISPKDTGNTLGKTVAKKLSGSKTYNKMAQAKMDEAIETIKTFKICALHHEDLEYKLIHLAKPIYNNCGKDED